MLAGAFTFYLFRYLCFLSKAEVTCPRRGAATRIKGASVGSETGSVPEPGALPPYMCDAAGNAGCNIVQEVKAGAVRFVSRRVAPSEGGKTRPCHKNVCLVVASTQYHVTCNVSTFIRQDFREFI